MELLNFRLQRAPFVTSSFYRPQTKFAKVMFLYLSVIQSTGWGMSRSRPRREVGGGLARGGIWPRPKGKVGRSGGGEVVSRPRPGGVSRPRPGRSRPTPGVDVQAQGVYPSMYWGRHPPPADGYCCGRYTSYWNAFLSLNLFLVVNRTKCIIFPCKNIVLLLLRIAFGLLKKGCC